ncbi:hypothetical protein [Maricaulis sp.]|uniref:hypothetical protein n=1 Tax=Maricaulis sp. TaxID=1486257 RepID=UPI003A94DC8F
MRTYSTSEFEIRIKDGLLEMRSEGTRVSQTGSDGERAFNSLLRSESIEIASFDIRSADFRFTSVELESRIRYIGRQCRGIPLAFIGRSDQQDQVRAAVRAIEKMDGVARGFRSREKALAWLDTMRQPA